MENINDKELENITIDKNIKNRISENTRYNKF